MKLLSSLLLLGTCVLSLSAQMPKIEPGVSHDLAAWRAAHYSDIRYNLNLTLEKMSPVLKGTIEIRVHVNTPAYGVIPIILDWRKIAGHENDSTITNVTINGIRVIPPPPPLKLNEELRAEDVAPQYEQSNDHLILDYTAVGENVIKLDFTSPILASGSAITRYIDKDDGSEYIYSILSPSNASTAFPMFDQPDLKGRFTLSISFPEDWRVVTNSLIKEGGGSISEPDFGHPEKSVTTSWVLFDDTKPISTYAFAFAAGPWREFSEAGVTGGNATVTERAPSKPAQASDTAGNSAAIVEGTLPNGRVSARADTSLSTHIYVRRSQAAKFQPHAADILKTARESNKYFDYRSAWPKYDLVLIPDLPSEVIQVPGITVVRESSIIREK